MAERIARRLSESATGRVSERDDSVVSAGELATLRAGLDDIQRRLAHIESHITHDEAPDPSARPPDARRRDDAVAHATRSHQVAGAVSSSSSPPTPTRSPWLSGTYVPATAAHPSEERFSITEAVSELVDYFEREKTCSVEPGEKPCDHCAMCSSRGY